MPRRSGASCDVAVTTGVEQAWVGWRLLGPGGGVGARTRPKRRGSSTMATTQVNGTDDRGPGGPSAPACPDGACHLGLRGPDPADRRRAPRGEDHPGLDHRGPPTGGAGLDERRPRRHVGPRARSSTPSGPSSRPIPGEAVLSGQPALYHRRADPPWSTSVRSSAPTARPNAGPWWPRSADSGPSRTWGRRRRRTPRSSPGTPTFTFDGTTYRSRYVTFAAVEEYGDRPSPTAPAGFPKLRDAHTGRVGAAQALRHRAVRARDGHAPLRRRRQPACGGGSGHRLLPRRPPGQVDGADRRRPRPTRPAPTPRRSWERPTSCRRPSAPRPAASPASVCTSPGVRAGASRLGLP